MIKKVLIIIGVIIVISIFMIFLTNNTFLKTTHIGINEQ